MAVRPLEPSGNLRLNARKPNSRSPKQDRTARSRERVRQPVRDRIGLFALLRTWDRQHDRVAELDLLDVHGNVDEHRPPASGSRDRIGLREFVSKRCGARHRCGVFRDRTHHLNNFGFLKSRLAHLRAMKGAALALIDLPSNVERRNRIEVRASNPRNEIRRPRPRSRHCVADRAIDSPERVRGHSGRLLMLKAGIGKRRVAGHCIDHECAGASGENENPVAPHLRQKLGDVLGSSHSSPIIYPADRQKSWMVSRTYPIPSRLIPGKTPIQKVWRMIRSLFTREP